MVKTKNPLLLFCRRFTATVTLFSSLILLCLTLLYTSNTFEAYFFILSSVATTLQYAVIYSSILLVLATGLALSQLSSSNINMVALSLLITNSAVTISEVAWYTRNYDTSEDEFRMDGLLIMWMLFLFLTTLLSLLTTILTIMGDVQFNKAATEKTPTSVVANPRASEVYASRADLLSRLGSGDTLSRANVEGLSRLHVDGLSRDALALNTIQRGYNVNPGPGSTSGRNSILGRSSQYNLHYPTVETAESVAEYADSSFM